MAKDFGDHLAAKLRRKPAYIILPRKRKDEFLEKGNIGLNCFYNRQWTQQPKKFHWTKAWLKSQNRFFTAPNYREQIKDLSDLNGKTIGTQLGYRYSDNLEAKLRSSAKRYDVKGLPQLLKMMNVRNEPQIRIGDLASLSYLKSRFPQQNPFKIAPLIASKYHLHCAVSKKSSIKITDVEKALTEIKHSKFLQQMLEKYFQPQFIRHFLPSS